MQDRAAAAAREQGFLAASRSYRAASDEASQNPLQLQCVTIDSLRWWIPHVGDAEGRSKRAITQGFPFRAILQTREMGIGGVMLDLGANIGRTSVVRVLLGDVRLVYAAEPEPANYACLVRNTREHRLRGFVLPDNVAIAAIRGEARLRRSRFIGGHRLLGREPKDNEETFTVETWPLDEWTVHVGVEHDAITLVKVDTQGAEVGVLQGATGLLARRRAAWQIEVDPGLLKAAGNTMTDLLALLERHFSHAIDLSPKEPGSRAQLVAGLRESLAYLGTHARKTDLLLYNAPESA